MQKFSLHTHTLGFDGRNREEEMVAQAEFLGWKRLGFSNHFIVHPRIKDSVMFSYAVKGGYDKIYSASFEEAIAKFESHYQKIDALKKETGMQLLKGMEVDYFAAPEWRKGFEKALKILKPDYLIGSAHFIEYRDTLHNSHDVKNASPIEQNMLLHRYWRNERAAVQSGLFDFMAHLDLMKKVGLGQDEKWQEEEQKTVAAIKNAGVRVELNTSGCKFGDEPYPSRRIMQMLAAAKVPVLLSDDAHSASQLGKYFEQTTELAHACGLNIADDLRFVPQGVKLFASKGKGIAD
ncbi:MAG: hypothetical protein IKR92_04465 [Alphaproteobacteria bacterium]|nr:hypothetical protein [Alphaproteobacteria bacterium]